MLIDTHAHLTDGRIDWREVLADMTADGLSRIVTVGYNRETSLSGLEISKTDGRIFCSLGFHPNNTHEVYEGYTDEFLRLARDEKVVAIGEIGLDYHYPDTDKNIQIREFVKQLELAKAADLPVIIHLRDAHEDLYRIVGENLGKLPKRGVMHCFSGSAETAKRYVDMGFYISFAGPVTFKNAKYASEVIRAVPKEKILVETDCPYLAPEPFRGKTNFPKYVQYTAEKIAEVLGIEFAEAAELTAENALRCFERMK